MTARWMIPLLLLPALAYTPSASEILGRMAVAANRGAPVQVQVIREDPEGNVLEETTVTVPAGSAGAPASSFLETPYASFTVSREGLVASWPSLAQEDATVALGRMAGSVCYILEGDGARLWISKDSLVPLQVETRKESGPSTVTRYLDMTEVSEEVRYPGRTEVLLDGTLVIVERVLPAAADTGNP